MNAAAEKENYQEIMNIITCNKTAAAKETLTTT